MDMKKILENMDSAAAGDKPSVAGSNVNDMKTILESIQQVEECGMGEGGMPMDMPSEPEDKMSMNVSLNARGDAVEDLIKLMGGAIAPQDAPVSMPMPMPSAGLDTHDHEMGDMKKMMKLASDADMEPDAPADEPEMEDWDNSPEEEYSDTKTMTKDLSGGINREKKMHKPAADGDNPIAVETSIKEQLWAALNEKMTAEGRGRGKKKTLKASRGNEDIQTTEGSRGKKSRGKKSRG
jgi:hypothetical protein